MCAYGSLYKASDTEVIQQHDRIGKNQGIYILALTLQM